MELLAHLWLPILAASIAVWVASALAWMIMPHHRDDWQGLPDEPRFVEAIRSMGLKPGNYGFPHCGTHKEAHSEEMKKKWMEGPAGWITVMKPPSMGKNMLLTFLVYVAVSALIAYVGSVAVPRGATFGHVMQVLGTCGVLAYCFAFIPNGVWFGTKPRAILMCMIDGLVYGLITGAIFAALWPK